MAIDATRLGNALKTEIETQIRTFLSLGATPYPQLTNFAEAMGKAIADKVSDEIKTYAAVKNGTWAGGTFTVTGASVTIPSQTITGGVE